MRVLISGLNQEVFELFISNEERTPYSDYKSLELALEKHAANPRVAARLKALKPGQSNFFHVTMASAAVAPAADVKSPNTKRFERIEHILTTFSADKEAKPHRNNRPPAGGPKSQCYN